MLSLTPTPGYHIPTGSPMRQFQIRGAHKIFTGTPLRDPNTGRYMSERSARDGTAVHVDPGLGKTIMVLTAAVWWFMFMMIKRPILIVAPVKVCRAVWRQEAQKWTHTRNLSFGDLTGNLKERSFELARGKQIYLINPEKLKWLIQYLRHDWSFFDVFIIDDVPLKDPRSQQFKTITNYGVRTAVKDAVGIAIRDINNNTIRVPPHRFKYSAKLTGTPRTTGLHNLWSPFYILDHGSRLHTHYETFEGRFFHKTHEVADHVFKIDINAEEAEARPNYVAVTGAPQRIHELIADITIELNAADYGILPRVIGDASKGPIPETHLHYIELPDNVRREYDRLEKDALIELEKDFIMAANGGAKSMMCWQIANGAIYRTDDFGRQEAVTLHDEKLNKLIELIDTLDTNIVVPYYFKHDFARIATRLQKEGIAFTTLNNKHTERTIDEFSQGRWPVMLLHPQSGGHGVDRLQYGAHTEVWFTCIWSLERYLQTIARLARGGQNEIVGVHQIAARKTVDDLMILNLVRNGTDQTSFREALRQYQILRGLSI